MGAIIELFYEIDNVCLNFWQIKPDLYSILNGQRANHFKIMVNAATINSRQGRYDLPCQNAFIV
jgi:protocatechuate 3,4-dioxygenase beta subunit